MIDFKCRPIWSSFFRFQRTEEWIQWWRSWWGNAPTQNFWARTAPAQIQTHTFLFSGMNDNCPLRMNENGFLCLRTRSAWLVALCIRWSYLRLCTSRALLIQYLEHILDMFSSDFQHWCSLGQGRKLQVLGSKGQNSRSRWVQLQRAGRWTFWLMAIMLTRCLANYWTEFRQTFSIYAFLGQWWKLLCMGSKGQRSRWQHDEGPSGRRHAELDAVRWVLISRLYFI